IVIEVAHGFGRHDYIVARLGRRDPAADAAPRHYGCVGRQTSLEDFVPADQALASLGEKLFHAYHEIALQRLLVGKTFGMNASLAQRARPPAGLVNLVTSDVH